MLIQVALALLALESLVVAGVGPRPSLQASERPPLQRFLRQLERLGEPAGAALLDGGDLYFSELLEGVVVSAPVEGPRTVVARGLAGPRGLEVSTGAEPRLWVAESHGPRVVELGLDGVRGAVLGPERLVRPWGLALTEERVYVADAGSHRVEVFARDGEHLFGFGGHGSAPGQLIEPRDVALGPDGRVYVADFGNSRVEVFDDEGQRVGGWGDWGPFPGLFMGPSGIEVRGDEVFVGDERNHRVQVFDLDGKALGQFGLHAIRPREGQGKLHYPRALSVSPDGELAVVLEPLLDRAQVFSRTGGQEEDALRKQVTGLGRPSAHFGRALSVSGPYLAIAEPESHTVLIYETTWDEPRRIARVSGLGVKTGLLSAVGGVDLARTDRSLLVCDPSLRRLSMFRLRGNELDEVAFDPRMSHFVKSYDFELGFAAPEFAGSGGVPEPLAVDRDPSGRLYVLDRRNRGVLVMEPDFSPVLAERTRLAFAEPADLAVDGAGECYAVSDPGRREVVLVSIGSEARAPLVLGGSDLFLEPHGVVFDDEGLLYVTDAGRDEVLVFDRAGEVVRRWGRRGLGRGEFLEPRGIAFDREWGSDGEPRLVVMDHANHRAQVFSVEGEYLGIFGSRLYTKPARFPQAVGQGAEEGEQ